MLSGTGSFYVFGGNPYAPELAYYPEHNTLSPLRTDGYYDKVDLIYTALLRNAKSLTYRITDAKTGETYYRKTVDYVASPSITRITTRSSPQAPSPRRPSTVVRRGFGR